MKLNNDPDFEVNVWILNHTGVLLFARVDEFELDEALISIALEQLPPLEASTRATETIEQGTCLCMKIYPNEKSGEAFLTHQIILKDEEVIDMFSETESDDKENFMDIIYIIKPKYTPAVADDYPKM